MATIAEHIAARNDTDLLQRLTAAAERAGIDAPAHWASTHAGRLVNADIDGSSLATVYAYAAAQKGLPAGADPEFVTDDQIEAAVAAVQDAQQQPDT